MVRRMFETHGRLPAASLSTIAKFYGEGVVFARPGSPFRRAWQSVRPPEILPEAVASVVHPSGTPNPGLTPTGRVATLGYVETLPLR